VDYPSVQRILDARGISQDPAYEDVIVQIAPIDPDERGRVPLGLYFPRKRLIVLPPALATTPNSLGEAVLLHEFGHRHGDFYYKNTSEQYAQDYQQRIQGKFGFSVHEHEGVA